MTSWLEGWQYRKSKAITAGSASDTDYPMKIKIHSGSGTDNNTDIFLSSHCIDFPNDIDFTDDDGSTELDFFIENETADPITVWVEVKDDVGSNQSIYIYYGKDGQSSLADGDATFTLFDHFLGDTLDLDKWKVTQGDVTVDNSCLVLTGTTGTRGYVYSQATIPINCAEHVLVIAAQNAFYKTHAVALITENSNNGLDIYDAGCITSATFKTISDGTNNATLHNLSPINDTPHIFSIKWIPNNGTLLKDDAVVSVHTNYVPSVNCPVRFVEGSTNGKIIYIDWVFIRKLMATEPVFGNSGEEETSGGQTISHTFSNDSLGGYDIKGMLSISQFKSDIVGGVDTLSSYIKTVIKILSDKIGNLDNKAIRSLGRVKTDIIGNLDESTLIDSFDNVSIDDVYIIRQHPSNDAGVSARGQTFKPINSYNLGSVKFYLKRTTPSPIGTLRAYLYTHTGTYGSTGFPTGDILATSITNMDMTKMSSKKYTLYEFIFSGTYILQADTPYCIALYSINGTFDANHYIYIASKSTGEHEGNGFYYNNNDYWNWHYTRDYYFYLYSTGLSSYIKAVVKTISDSIGQIENKIKYSSKFLSDKISNIESKIKGVIKSAFSDKIGAKETLQFVQYMEETFIEVLGIVESKTRIKKYIRLFLESTGLKHKYNDLKNFFKFWHKERPRQKVSSNE